jgi:hypothetical protein
MLDIDEGKPDVETNAAEAVEVVPEVLEADSPEKPSET